MIIMRMKMTMIMRVITITVTMMVMVMTKVMVTAVLVNGSKSNTEEGHMTDNTNQDNSHFFKHYLHFSLFLFNAKVYFLVWVLWTDSKAASPSIPWTVSLGVPSRPRWEGLEVTGSFTTLFLPLCWAQNAKDVSTNPTHTCTLIKHNY